MFNDFTGKGHSVSYETYRHVFASENIGFGENRTDDCECCLQFEHHKKDALPNHDSQDCETCTASEKHLQSAKIARHKYKEDMEKPNSYAVDMQKVMLIPKLTTKESFLCRDLYVSMKQLHMGAVEDKTMQLC